MAVFNTMILLPLGDEDLLTGLSLLVGLSLVGQIWQWIMWRRLLSSYKIAPSAMGNNSTLGKIDAGSDNILIQTEQLNQIQQLNQQLERLVQERTEQLRLAYDFEASLKRITDRVRDSLDEDHILQTAVKELTIAVGALGCNSAVYDLDEQLSTIRYEYTTTCVLNGRVLKMANFLEGYRQLLAGQFFQFCSLQPNPERGRTSMLACPIQDDQGVLGDLWLVHQPDYAFSEQDIRLMQQVANQCAIAIRQARLYQTAQGQVRELERLNALKDDFLSTVSHELRTPISNVKMAIQMLEMAINDQVCFTAQQPEGAPDGQSLIPSPSVGSWNLKPVTSKVHRYLQILKDECNREIELINDLLDLSRLDANAEPLMLATLNLLDWLPQLIKPFAERIRNQQQQLIVELPDQLPPLTTEVASLERILTELLNNACKYTPPGETIKLTCCVIDQSLTELNSNCHGQLITRPNSLGPLRSSPPPALPSLGLQIEVSNSGVNIDKSELTRIFDKFYRIPKNDPWKYGGTGLGLALVKKLIERLQGNIEVDSSSSWVTFRVTMRSLRA
ncbi:MAG: GAF domain-containing sensor histidine kinase [Cyanobacteria bacterium]|nr:GAF domain-containing sensor histidine kinase [Cyanobacteriota bacterium]MDW8200605.1 ATP-binding protein [Cyanobacteriota bacterium SKYGB_h_bin112]